MPVIDEQVEVLVRDVQPGHPVTLQATMTDRIGNGWRSRAMFTADERGVVRTVSMPSVEGTYHGVDPIGLFWSMQPESDVAMPYPFVDAADIRVDLELRDGEVALDHAILCRTVGTQVDMRPVTDHGLVADLYLPAGWPSPRPGLLFLGGSEGGQPDPAYARLLASHGYVVLGLAYFGVDGLPDALDAIPVEYGLSAVDWLAAHRDVADGPIGVYGLSRGGDYALLFASMAPERFGAVVSVVGSDLVWPALTFEPGRPHSSWTSGGVELPVWSPASTPAEKEAARIRTEAIAAPTLFVSAGADGLLPSESAAERALSAIEAVGNPHQARHLHHPHAGHLVGGLPGMPTTVSSVATSDASLPLDVGGDPAATAHAVSTTHAAVVDFLGSTLPTSTNSR